MLTLFKRMVYEFSDNGGGSMKDRIGKMVVMITDMRSQIDMLLGWRKAIFYENQAPMFINNEHGTLVDVNKAWVNKTQLRKELATGHGWEKIIHPDDIKRLHHEGIDFIKDGNSYESKFRIITYETKDVIYVLCTATKVLDSSGKLLSVIGTLEEVTKEEYD
jgi:PAS domain S-box-containing protein